MRRAAIGTCFILAAAAGAWRCSVKKPQHDPDPTTPSTSLNDPPNKDPGAGPGKGGTTGIPGGSAGNGTTGGGTGGKGTNGSGTTTGGTTTGGTTTGGTTTAGGSGSGTTAGGTTGGTTGQPPDNPYAHTVLPNSDSIQKNLINPYCLGCHSGASPHAKLDLTNLALYADGKVHTYPGYLIVPSKPKTSMIIIVMKQTHLDMRMPPVTSGIPAVLPDQIKAVEDWISALPPLPTQPDGGVDISLIEGKEPLSVTEEGGDGYVPE